MSKLSEDQIKEIIKLYSAGEKPAEIGKKFNIFSNSVNRIIRKHNPSLTKTKKIDKDLQEKMQSMYQAGISSEKIAKELNISGSTVCRNLKKIGVDIKPSEENKRKYKINQNFFNKIDSEESAYFLGFLYADGHISSHSEKKNYFSVKMTLSRKDREILEKFSKLIYGEVNLTDSRRPSYGSIEEHDYSNISIYSKKMHGDLVRLGCEPNKSLTLQFPGTDKVPDHFMRHFIRGYFDGDGCLSRGIKYVVDITSSEDFLNGMITYLKNKININFNKLQRRHKDRETTTRNIQITKGSSIATFLNYIYDDSHIYLERKRGYFEEFKSNKPHLFLNI